MRPSEKSIQLYLSSPNHLVPEGYAAFLAQHGRFWQPAPLPKAVKQQKQGECFKNAGELALSNPELTYVEGLALHTVLPTAHAWCIDPAGHVLDPTWAYVESSAYFGIPFCTDFLFRHLDATRLWGIVADGIPAPLISAPPDTFLARPWQEALGITLIKLSPI